MELAVLISKHWAIYFSVISIWVILHRKNIPTLLNSLLNNDGLNFILSILTFGLGIVLVINYSFWVEDWRLLITFIHWVVLIKGITLLFFPKWVVLATEGFLNSKKLLIVSTCSNLMFAGFFAYYGFLNNITSI